MCSSLPERCREILCIAALLSFFSACVYLPQTEDKVVTQSIPPDPGSNIAHMLGQDPQAMARALLIGSPELALASRIHLIEAAQNSIDLQYFIWQNDLTGILLIEELLQAADRGVRIRALIDDVLINGLTNSIATLNQHPNVEIRIFNPFSVRTKFPLEIFRLAEFAIDGNRLNHRMHNKLLVADNQLALVGGRNIGNEYFGQSEDWNFIDTDILLSGPLIPELSLGFDTYWNSRWSYPVRAVINIPNFNDLNQTRERIHERLADRPDLYALTDSLKFEDTLNRLALSPRIMSSQILVDDPDVSWFQRPDELAIELAQLATTVQNEVLIVSPYLIPTSNLLDIGETLIGQGVKVSILTNSLATNNHVSAHAAYSNFRQRILDMGIAIYELKSGAEAIADIGTTGISLHTKYIVFDSDIVFIGSLNLDPRSLYLNTELGVVMESPDLVHSLRVYFDEMIQPENSYRLRNTPEGIQWQSSTDVLTRDPANSLWQRIKFTLFGILPISSQL